MFALLPFLTRVVPPDDFGRITVATTVAGLAGIVMGLGLETPVFRVWFSAAPDARARAGHLRTARTLLGVSTTSILLVVVLGAWLAPLATDAWSPVLITIAAVGAVASAVVTSYVLPLLRAQDRLRAYMAVQLSIAIVQPLLLSVFVLVLGWGAVGWVAATSVAGWIATIVGSRRTEIFRGTGEYSATARRSLLGLGLPLIPHALSHWALNGVDRLVLVAFVSSASVGVYGLSYRIAQAVGLVLTELNRAMMNEFGRLVGEGDRVETRQQQLGGLAEVQIAAAVAVGFVAAALGPPIFRLIFPPEYEAGAAVLPWVALGYALYGVYFVPTQLLVLIEGRSGWLWTGTATGAIVNLGANLLLIPRVGIQGAAQATAIGYAAMLFVVSAYAWKTVSVRPQLRTGRVLTLVLFSAALTGVVTSSSGPHATWLVALPASCVVAAVAGWVIWAGLRSVHNAQSNA